MISLFLSTPLSPSVVARSSCRQTVLTVTNQCGINIRSNPSQKYNVRFLDLKVLVVPLACLLRLECNSLVCDFSRISPTVMEIVDLISPPSSETKERKRKKKASLTSLSILLFFPLLFLLLLIFPPLLFPIQYIQPCTPWPQERPRNCA